MSSNISFKSINIEGKVRPDVKAKVYKFDGKTSAVIEKVGMGYNVSILNGKTEKFFFTDVLVKSVDGGSKVIINDTMNNNRPLHIKKIRKDGTIVINGSNLLENDKNRTSDLVPPNIIVNKIEDGGVLNTMQSAQALVISNLAGGTINSRQDCSIDVMHNNGHINMLSSPLESKQTLMVKNNGKEGTVIIGNRDDDRNKSNFIVRIFNHLGSLINNMSNDCMIDNLFPNSEVMGYGGKSTIDIRDTSRISDKDGYLSRNINLYEGSSLTDAARRAFLQT